MFNLSDNLRRWSRIREAGWLDLSRSRTSIKHNKKNCFVITLQQIQPVSGIPVSWFRYLNKPGWKFSMQSRSPVHPRERIKKTATGQLATRYSCAVCDGSFGLGNPCHRSLSVFLCPLPSPLLALQWRPGPLRRGGLFNLSQYVDRTSVFIFFSQYEFYQWSGGCCKPDRRYMIPRN